MDDQLKKKLEEIARKLLQKAGFSLEGKLDFGLVHPKEEFGDYSTNLALVLSQKIKKNPLLVAEDILSELKDFFPGEIAIAGPGHINFSLSEEYFSERVEEIIEKGSDFAQNNSGENKRVNNEFISANPTGPMHLGNGRGGFLGDTLSRVLRKNGYVVTNEYYVNDGGGQVLKLGHSVLKDDLAEYHGEYIDELHEKFKEESEISLIGEKAADYILDHYIKPTVEDEMGIHFDAWISEKKDILNKNYVEKALEIFKEKGLTFEEEGALWLKTTNFSDDKDRVLVKSNGERTYFVNDCGYLLHKISRGFQELILILGADHHGYINRFKAAAKALGFSGEIRVLIVQMAKLMKNGQEVRMSKRAGNIVTISELIEKVGLDVTRFFFLMYVAETHMTFDLGLAEEKSEKNPVFYVQYAHARMASLIRKAEEKNIKNWEKGEAQKVFAEKEKSLVRQLDLFPELIREICETSAVHKLPYYAIKLADRFHSFYNECQVIDENDLVKTQNRLRLVLATKIVLGETLRLIGVTAPEKM